MIQKRDYRAERLGRVRRNISPERSASFPRLEWLLKILTVPGADVVVSFATLLVIVAGGVWGIHKYYASGADSWAINVKLETKVLPYRDKLRLLVVNIKSVNPRHFETELDRRKGDVFELRFREIPSEMNQWDVTDEDEGKLIRTVNILPEDVPYDFVPGLEMDDMRAIVVPVNTTVLVTAEIDRRNGTLDKAGKPDVDFVSASTAVSIR